MPREKSPEEIFQDSKQYPKNLLLNSRPRKSFRNEEFSRTEKPIPNKLYKIGQLLNGTNASTLATIGSRKIETNFGQETVKKIHAFLARFFVLFNKDFPKAELITVSGLALSGDQIGHETSLVEGIPNVAVLPTEIDFPHPEEHTQLYHRIIRAGETQPGNAILSEYGPKDGAAMSPKYYDRNRITTWMSGVVLTYGITRPNSGAMHAALLARHAQIPVFFIAGTVSSSAERRLVELGAQAVNSPEHMIELLHKNRPD